MSTGHKREDTKPAPELYRVLGEADTPELYSRPVTLDTSHTIAYSGGISVDGKTVYIDALLYREIMSGKTAVKGMSPRQLVQAFIEHEHTEKSISDGDNGADVYEPCHEFALTKEHQFVKRLGIDPDRYEKELGPALKRCLSRPQTNPPRDLWCGPYLDHADKHDKEILRQFRKHGVKDAFKLSKFVVHYSIGAQRCEDCAMFGKGKGPLRECELVSGLVRNTRWCERWVEAKGK